MKVEVLLQRELLTHQASGVVEQTSASGRQRSTHAVTVIGGGRWGANNAFIQQIFIECLSKTRHCTRCLNICPGLFLTLNLVETSKPLITFYPMCVSVNSYIFMWVCAHMCARARAHTHTHTLMRVEGGSDIISIHGSIT